MAHPSFSISDTRERPQFAPVVADRVWRVWWKPKGHALAPIEAFMRSALGPDVVPSVLVADDGGTYPGSALVIASDLDSRPQYTPWNAAVWVDANRRSRGVGSDLVRAGTAMAKAAHIERIFICAMPNNHGFNRRLGWMIVETDVDGEGLAVFRCP